MSRFKRRENLWMDHGHPVAKVFCVDEDEEAEVKSMQGLVTKYVDPCEPVDVQWEAVS